MSLCLLSGTGTAADTECGDWAAITLSVEGRVEIRRQGQSGWSPLSVGEQICLNDSIRTLDYSRAAVMVPTETPLRLDENTTATFRPDQEKGTLLDILKGLIGFISRDSRALNIATPYANAGLEGTEFVIGVTEDGMVVAVYEGTVVVENGSGRIAVDSGRQLTVRPGGTADPIANLEDRNGLLWSRYFPTLLAGPLPAADQTPDAGGGAAAFLARRAQRRLAVGQIAAAREDLAAALAVEQGQPDALALEAMIALAERDPVQAEQTIGRALAGAPDSVAALLARTYLLEDRGELREALDVARRASELAPADPIALTRQADMLLGLGVVGRAREAANAALAADPDFAAAHSALGFAELKAGEPARAMAHFEDAIALDSAAALPRVGIAIAAARTGRLAEKRDQLEAAVLLDVNDSTVRSYMGKAYLDEFRDELAAVQLTIASALDEDDPTPRIYQAIGSQARNDSVAAFGQISAAIAVSGDRGPFRPGLPQDEDLAARATGLGQIYRAVGFEEEALVKGSHAIMLDPAGHTAHRLVSDTLADFARYQIARVGEDFQARMLQPANVLPFVPQLAQINLSIADSVGPAALAHAEARSSFASNGLDVLTSGVAGGNATRGQNVVVSGLYDGLSFNVGEFRFRTEGFRPNGDIEHEVLSGFVQSRLSGETSLQLELRSARTDKGYIGVYFDPAVYDTELRQRDESDSIRVGVTRRTGSFSTMLASVTYERIDVAAERGTAFSAAHDVGGLRLDLQFINELPSWNLVSGIRVYRDDVESTSTLLLPIPDPPFLIESTEFVDQTRRHIKSYAYATRTVGESLYLTVGAAVDRLDGQQVSGDETNAKLGLTWRPLPETYLRIAAFETTFGSLISKQLVPPSLEPMQVAGFPQYVYGAEGEQARNYGLGLDHALTANLRLAVDLRERSVDVPLFYVIPPSPTPIRSDVDVREKTAGARVYWTPNDRLAIKAGWEYEDFDNHGTYSPANFGWARTNRFPLHTTLFLGRAFSLRLAGTHISQKGEFVTANPISNEFVPGESDFWVFDGAVDYRLPKRLGSIELGVKNLLDEEFRFQDTDPDNPHVFPERFAYLRFTLSL